jgi:hypothetical protein
VLQAVQAPQRWVLTSTTKLRAHTGMKRMPNAISRDSQTSGRHGASSKYCRLLPAGNFAKRCCLDAFLVEKTKKLKRAIIFPSDQHMLLEMGRIGSFGKPRRLLYTNKQVILNAAGRTNCGAKFFGTRAMYITREYDQRNKQKPCLENEVSSSQRL